MLQVMREKMAGFVTWFFVIILILVFALFGLGYYFSANRLGSQVVAKVNGQDITDRQLQLATDNLRRHQGLGALSAKQQVALKKTALKALVLQSVLTQNASKIGLGVSQQEIDALLYHMPAFQQDGQFSPSRYQAILQNLGLTTEGLRQQLSATILSNQFEQSIVESAFALPNEVQHFSALQSETRAVRYLPIKHTLFRQQVQIKPAQIEHYYQKNNKRFYSKEKVRLAYVVLSLKQLESKISVSTSQAKQYYQQHKSSFAKQTFAKAKAKIIQSIKAQKAQQEYGSLGDRLSNLAFENPDSLSFVSKQLGLPIHTTGWITKAGAKTGIAANKKVIQSAFSDDVLKQGNNSAIINLSDSKAVVLRVQGMHSAKPKPLSAVKKSIVATLTAQQEAQYAEQYAQNLATKINHKENVVPLLARYHLRWHSLSKISRDSDQLPTAIIAKIFRQPVPLKGHSATAAFSEPDLSQTYLMQVLHIHLDKVPLTKAEKATYSLVLSQAWSAGLYQNYVNLLKSQAKIQYIAQKQ